MKSSYIKSIKLLLLILSLSSLIILAFPRELFRNFWEYAWYILLATMLVRPLRDIFPKFFLFSFIFKFRRELWILVWVFALAHVIWYFIDNMTYFNYTKTYIDLFFDKSIWDYAWFMFWGMLWFLISIPLLLTSNWLSTSILWKKWKILQRLSYFMFLFVVIHIYLIKWEIQPLIVFALWITVYIIALIKNKKIKKSYSPGVKWLCVPCWYIYDESIWDPDSWINPWTKFEDIPDDWRCPVCFVWKKDFIPYDENTKLELVKAEIISYIMLTSDILEITLKPQSILGSIPWQYMIFLMKDNSWEFRRSYSIVENKNWKQTFCIKLNPDWRWSKILKNLKVWDSIDIVWIFWDFIIKDTTFKKVFIATWTWLAPIINMLKNNTNSSNLLLFWVSNKEELIYEYIIKSITNLEYKIFVSREKVEWYEFWRIDLSKFDFEENTEFYICWNPSMLKANIDYLSEKWFKNIYCEKFY